MRTESSKYDLEFKTEREPKRYTAKSQLFSPQKTEQKHGTIENFFESEQMRF